MTIMVGLHASDIEYSLRQLSGHLEQLSGLVKAVPRKKATGAPAGASEVVKKLRTIDEWVVWAPAQLKLFTDRLTQVKRTWKGKNNTPKVQREAVRELEAIMKAILEFRKANQTALNQLDYYRSHIAEVQDEYYPQLPDRIRAIFFETTRKKRTTKEIKEALDRYIQQLEGLQQEAAKLEGEAKGLHNVIREAMVVNPAYV